MEWEVGDGPDQIGDQKEKEKKKRQRLVSYRYGFNTSKNQWRPSSKGSTESSCAATLSTSPSSSPVLSSVNGLWIMEFIGCGSTVTLGNDMKTLQFWGKGQQMNELWALPYNHHVVFVRKVGVCNYALATGGFHSQLERRGWADMAMMNPSTCIPNTCITWT